MKILAVDSSAVTASVCLTEDRTVCGEYFVNTKQKHSGTLMPMLESLLASLGVKPSEIDLFAVSVGPGSFTGVRIGVSCIKGLAMPFDTPCAAVSTLDAMVQPLVQLNGILCPVMDARCGQVYNALFSAENGALQRLTEDRAVSVTELAAECGSFGKPVYLVGDGAQLCYQNEAFRAAGAVLVPEAIRYQRASGVAAAAYEKTLRGETISAQELMPFYLRPPQAQRERGK